ncbi:MAG TPA: protein-L-isoaspartate(D-aspartate) O-methyltransferase [Candidatus Omnitrophica bacterium]|nr:MAG: protein-L-isoaspartate O-methyltransferase [Candidatus Omnitrophota bacterium]RKY42707.1 MAG: protein-L-isoaspartate O-methyltransferase [Candidatus Omnitrophota bacterium]HEC68798.1 protein-L-isoaspartate(D-aspartate) O-methyltransferase [Candidatus Omnitrophota bacterium]
MRKNYSDLRREMVEEQIIARGIKDKRVISAFSEIPREEFVPFKFRDLAYRDFPLSIGYGQTISQPYMVALMTEVLDPFPGEKILEIGTGSGYQSAILAYLGAKVFSIERIPELAKKAQENLVRLGYQVQIKVGDGTLGWEEEAPFAGIIVTAGVDKVPSPLMKQLAIGGRMVIPLGGRLSQVLTKIEKLAENNFRKEEICGCIFVPLLGKYGYSRQ